jgi:hypothetical protein
MYQSVQQIRLPIRTPSIVTRIVTVKIWNTNLLHFNSAEGSGYVCKAKTFQILVRCDPAKRGIPTGSNFECSMIWVNTGHQLAPYFSRIWPEQINNVNLF